MKYRILLSTLRFLVYLKRGVWWFGEKIGRSLNRIWVLSWGVVGLIGYKTGYFLKKLGFSRSKEWVTKRDVFQIALFIFLMGTTWTHTKLPKGKDLVLANQKTIVFKLFAPSDEYAVEEVLADVNNFQELKPVYREGAFTVGASQATGVVLTPARDVASVVAGGAAFTKPILINTGDSIKGARTEVTEYIVEPGDSLGSIAQEFGVSVATILWENNLTARSLIRPGDVLRILPSSGVLHLVKKGDTLNKIALLYGVSAEDISDYNNIDNNSLKAGVKILVPNGKKSSTNTVSTIVKRPIVNAVGVSVAAPPRSTSNPSTSGFIWPSGIRYISQYFSWKHNALDIAGPWQTPTYAAKAGVVEKAQCGWNGGYGCYVVINHGGGIKTLYAHHSQLLVTPGEEVEQGQTIALMGNSGNVHGVTGIHLHFEVIVNGARVNPLGYVRP